MNWKIALFGIGIVLHSCTKIELPPPDDDPEVPTFQLSWENTNGGSSVLAAGEMGYRVVSEPVINSEGIWELSSRLEETDCFEQCGPSIEFILFDLEVDSDGQVDPNLLEAGLSYPFAGGVEVTPGDTTGSGWGLNLNGLTDGGGSNLDFIWTIFSDTMVAIVGQNVTYFVEDSNPFEVCLAHNDAFLGCNTQQCQTIVPSTGPEGLSTRIQEVNPVGDQLEAVTTGGVPPYSYSWSTGENTSAINANTPGIYSVTIVDNNSQTASSSVNVSQQPNNPLCSAYFDYTFNEQVVITPGDTIPVSDFGGVEVRYTDEDGVVFTSRNAASDPDPNSFFMIDTIEPYDGNEPGQVIEFRFHTVLEDEEGNSMIFENGEGRLVFFLP